MSIGGAKNMTKPTRKRYTFTPSNRSSQFRDFKQVWLLAAYQRYLVFFTRMENFIFGATSRRSPQKMVKFIFRAYFRLASRLCFLLRSLWNLGSVWHPQLMHTKPFVYSYGNRIFMVFTPGEPITFEIGACRFNFPLYCFDRLKFQLSLATSE